MPTIHAKIRSTIEKAKDKGHHSLAAAGFALIGDDDSLDARINYLGAMQEVGMLSNSLAPYWKIWRSEYDHYEWLNRCIERLCVSDFDYWALSALMTASIDSLPNIFKKHNLKVGAVRYAESPQKGRWHIASFYRSKVDSTFHPVIELGWDASDRVNEASRWRALTLNTQKNENAPLVGIGSGTYYMRAALPYGCWRIHYDDFEIKEDWTIPKSETIFNEL